MYYVTPYSIFANLPPRREVKPDEVNQILLTGVTGFIGT